MSAGKIAAGAVGEDKLATDAVIGVKIKDGDVTNDKLAGGINYAMRNVTLENSFVSTQEDVKQRKCDRRRSSNALPSDGWEVYSAVPRNHTTGRGRHRWFRVRAKTGLFSKAAKKIGLQHRNMFEDGD